ncbi:MAG: branched-chain amino acid ABC transporter permease [Dehalococcoidia bacterium]|nr:branched-chain amino acid ABC transporter permease [Dehalococcoidia bacterium]
MTEFLQLVANGVAIGSLYALIGLSVVIIYKATHVVSLAHGELLALGALFFWFVSAVLRLPLWLSLLSTFAVAAIMGFAVERFLRPLIGESHLTTFMMTFAIFMILDAVFQFILKGSYKVLPPLLPVEQLQVAGVVMAPAGLFGLGIALLLFIALAGFFRYTKSGLGMRATSESHALARSAGINVRDIFSLVWIISAVLASASGIVVAMTTDIGYTLPWIIIKGMVVALFGGLDSLPGALAAGLLLGVLESIGAGYLDPLVGGGFQDVTAFIVLLLILLVRPYGLFGLAKIERV